MKSVPAIHRLTACAGLALLAAACAPKTPETEPRGGTVTVGVTTTGPGLKGLTFRLKLAEDVVVKTIDADAGVASFPIGAGQLQLILEVPGRCRVEGGPERKIVVVEKSVTPVRYTVICQ